MARTMANLLYLILFAACTCFMASRVYLLISRGELNVKGAVYTRRGTRPGYWLTLFFASLGTAVCALITTALIFGIATGMP